MKPCPNCQGKHEGPCYEQKPRKTPTPGAKQCPFIKADCLENQCALWLPMVYTTENLRADGRCSFKFSAEKNSEGYLPV